MKNDDGGTAFATGQISVLDYFAGVILPCAAQMQLLNVQQLEAAGQLEGVPEDEGNAAMYEGCAHMAYQFAAAMLAERQRRKERSEA